jgi:DNA-binding beta-propeller fold protein YncE
VLLLLPCVACSRCGQGPRLDAAGPRLLSNETAQPIMLWGRGFPQGAQVRVGAPLHASLEAERLDAQHLTALLPPLPLPPEVAEAQVELRVHDAQGRALEGRASLTIVNDAAYPMPTGLVLSGDGRRAFALSSTTDELWVYPRGGGSVQRIAVGDGPRALALFGQGADETLAIVHEHDGTLRLLRTADLRGPQRTIAVGRGALGLAIDGAGQRAYVSNHVLNAIQIVDLQSGAVLGRLPAGVRPRALALGAGRLYVANAGSEDVSAIELRTGRETRIQPRRGAPIVGGHNERFSPFVMGGKQPRALAWSDKCARLFVASAGLNIGPNPQRMEISSNGGVGVIDPATGRFERHVSILAGIPAALALDEARGLLYAADVSRGLLTLLDVARLCGSEQDARKAVVASLPLPIVKDEQTIRPAADFAVQRRAGLEIHAGPAALALADQGRTVLVLSRFSGALTEIDASQPAALRVRAVVPGPPMGAQRQRRLGEILYFTDLGRSSMSCDGCHPDGHDGGVFFAKDHPQRIYRANTLRGVRETPPYFFPAEFPTLELTAQVVLARNRLFNPPPDANEVAALALFQRTVAPLPNPHLGPRGAPPAELALPDGRRGSPRRGLLLFEGKAGCSARECHPGPQFTADQDPRTRGLAHDVGTPMALPLRMQWQEAPPGPHAVPSLQGAWDEFPLLASGAGGLEVAPDGTLEPRHPFALRRVLELRGGVPHGAVAALDAKELDDLLAYLLTL